MLHPGQKYARRGNVSFRRKTFPRRPLSGIFQLVHGLPDVETFHNPLHGGTFPRRAVFGKTFPRRVFQGDVETFLIRALCPVQKYARRGNVFRALANVSTSVSFLNVSTSGTWGVGGRAAAPRIAQRGNVFSVISGPKTFPRQRKHPVSDTIP